MRKLRVLLARFVAFATFSLGANAATILTENVAGVNWTYYYNKDGYVNVGGGAQSTAVDSSQSGALVVPDALGGLL